MIRFVLFDFDGTLYDTVEGIARSAQYALNKLGVTAEPEELRCFAGPPLVDIFMEKYAFSQEKAWEARGLFQERYLPIGVYESRPFAGMKEFLGALREAGLELAVATSKPLIVERVIAALGADKKDCVLVGDTKYDVAGAHAAGIGCIGVRYGYAAPGELEEAGADAIVENLPELQKMLTCGENLV